MQSPVLIYDGNCGLCNACVRFILRYERKKELFFLHRQSSKAQQILQSNGFDGCDSLFLIANGKLYSYADAAIRVGTHMGGWWKISLLALVVPAPLRNLIYRVVAANRHRFSSGNTCYLTEDESIKARFI